MDWEFFVMLLVSLPSTYLCDPYEFSDCFPPKNDADKESTIFKFKVYGLQYDEFDFKKYEGNVMLSVNVASF